MLKLGGDSEKNGLSDVAITWNEAWNWGLGNGKKKKKKNSEKYCGLMGTGNIFMVIPTIHVNHRNIILSVLLDFHAIV